MADSDNRLFIFHEFSRKHLFIFSYMSKNLCIEMYILKLRR